MSKIKLIECKVALADGGGAAGISLVIA